MKTLRVSVLALCTMSFFACQKETTELSTDASANPLFKIAGTQGGSDKPDLIPTQTGPFTPGNPVTVTYTAKDATSGASVSCGKVFIYMWDGTAWLQVNVANSPAVSYTFTPQTAADCAYKFRAGFAPGGGGGATNCSGSYAGVDHLTEPDFCVEVNDACVQEFTIDSAVVAEDLKDGTYKFTISYTLTSPENVTGVKFQGGATAGGNINHQVVDYGNTTVVNLNNNNTVLKWEGDLVACQPQTVTFTFIRNFSCPSAVSAVTGNWSASVGATLLGSVMPVEYGCN